jgi:hypothetical protein
MRFHYTPKPVRLRPHEPYTPCPHTSLSQRDDDHPLLLFLSGDARISYTVMMDVHHRILYTYTQDTLSSMVIVETLYPLCYERNEATMVVRRLNVSLLACRERIRCKLLELDAMKVQKCNGHARTQEFSPALR